MNRYKKYTDYFCNACKVYVPGEHKCPHDPKHNPLLKFDPENQEGEY